MLRIKRFLNYKNYINKITYLYDMYIYGYFYSIEEMEAIENRKFEKMNLEKQRGKERLDVTNQSCL